MSMLILPLVVLYDITVQKSVESSRTVLLNLSSFEVMGYNQIVLITVDIRDLWMKARKCYSFLQYPADVLSLDNHNKAVIKASDFISY